MIARSRVLHLSGITPALSDTAHAAVVRALELAKTAGAIVSFDINYRSALWDRARATRVLWDLARQADVVFADDSELALVGELGSVSDVVTKRGADGASSRVGGVRYEQPAVPVRTIDVVGAGDALVAGYLSGLIAGFEPAQRLRLGCLVAGFAVSTAGDWEGLPTRDELGLLDLPPGTTVR
jgi:2-dehydro-3-deoxygluconokinase